MKSIVERLNDFHLYLKGNGYGGRNVFEVEIGKKPGYLTTALKKGTGLGSDVLENLATKFPMLNMQWLLTGEGEMLNNADSSTPKSKRDASSSSSDTSYTTYLLPMSAMGGSLTGFAMPGAELKDCEKIISPIENVDFAITVYGESMSPEYPSGSRVLIKNDSMTDSKPFAEYIDEYISRGMKNNTAELYTQTKNKILAYDPQCTFDTMNLRWLEAFDHWMMESGMKTNSRSIHMRNIRTIFNYAIDNEETTLYPFRKFTIKKEETRKRSLTAEQLATLRDFPCEEYQEEYRDMFMLMFYLIGINAVDLFHLKGIVNGRIEYKREKTGRLYSIRLEPEAIAIIEKYKGVAYLLNVLERNEGNYRRYMAAMNRGIAKIGDVRIEGRGGKKIRQPLFPDISSYWSRHTWATIAASLDIPKETISAALGHELGSRVTSIYIDFDQRKVDEANRKVIDYINNLTTSTT